MSAAETNWPALTAAPSSVSAPAVGSVVILTLCSAWLSASVNPKSASANTFGVSSDSITAPSAPTGASLTPTIVMMVLAPTPVLPCWSTDRDRDHAVHGGRVVRVLTYWIARRPSWKVVPSRLPVSVIVWLLLPLTVMPAFASWLTSELPMNSFSAAPSGWLVSLTTTLAMLPSWSTMLASLAAIATPLCPSTIADRMSRPAVALPFRSATGAHGMDGGRRHDRVERADAAARCPPRRAR